MGSYPGDEGTLLKSDPLGSPEAPELWWSLCLCELGTGEPRPEEPGDLTQGREGAALVRPRFPDLHLSPLPHHDKMVGQGQTPDPASPPWTVSDFKVQRYRR